MEEYLNNLLNDFISESEERLDVLNHSLLKLEKEPTNKECINSIFRIAHTLKGDSAVMGFEKFKQITHKMEDVFHLIRNNKLKVTPSIIDIFLSSCDFLRSLLAKINTPELDSIDIQNVLNSLEKIVIPEEITDETPELEEKKEKKSKSQKLELSEKQQNQISKDKKNGKRIYHGILNIKEDIPVISLIVYMLFTKIENIGNIIWSDPEENEIDNYEGTTISFLISTEIQKNEIESILKIPECKKIQLSLYSEPKTKTVKTENDAKTEQSLEIKKSMDSTIFGSLSGNLRVDPKRVDKLLNLVGELVINRSMFSQMIIDIKKVETELDFFPDLKKTVAQLKVISNELQEGIMQLRMIKIEQIFNKFPRLVRDISRKMNKKINLQITGQDTELDKRVIEEIKDPIMHIVRNCIDHGIETCEERKEIGKEEKANLSLNARHEGNQIIIKIADDGKGISPDSIKHKAIELGIISKTEAENLSERDLQSLIFQPGFSTSSTINDMSGRGVGMDVVKKNVERLNGSISIDSTVAKGTCFEIRLPLTLAIIPALLVKVINSTYALPLSSVTEIIEITGKDIKMVNGNEMITLRNKPIPIIRLVNFFHPEKEYQEVQNSDLAIVNIGDQLVGLIVDKFLGEQEIVIKSLKNELTETIGVSGASILGDGTIALILDVSNIIKKTSEIYIISDDELKYQNIV